MKAYYNEHDSFAAQWLRNLIAAGEIPEGDVDERDIQKVQGSDLEGFDQVHLFAGIAGWSLALKLAGWPDDRPVWTGSCPCQPFSVAGKQGGLQDHRHLWPAMFDLIKERRPPAVCGEQVVEAIKSGWLDLVFDNLESEGYACWTLCIDASIFGAKHKRHRLYWAGIVPDAISPQGDLQHGRPGGLREQGRNGLDAGKEAIRSTHGETDPNNASRFLPRAWATGPGEIGSIPFMADGLSVSVARCIGNSIMPQVAAEFIGAYMEARLI